MVTSLYGNATMTIDCGNVCIVSERLTTRVKIDVNEINRPFPSSKKSHFQSEAKCEAIDMKMIFNYDANQTHFHNKGFWKWDFWNSEMAYCWFSHDVTKIQNKKKLSTLPRFYFHDALEQLKLIFASKGFLVLR